MECEDYLNVPLGALRCQSRSIISRELNATKVIPSPSGFPRDWRGLADIAGCSASVHFGCADPTALVLASWQSSRSTIGQLIEALKKLDRYDVIDDTLELLESDAKDYLDRLQGGSNQLVEVTSNDDLILTLDDAQCIESCGKPQCYDAFLLYDDNDEEFAMTILDKLEIEYKLKLCTKDRDLVAGLSFEHEAIMQLIMYRCQRLIVVVSPAFLNSSANKFFLTFAQAIGIEQRQRKIIPCVYTNFQLPLQLRYYFVLNFSRTARQWNFWKQLSQSIRTSNARIIITQEDSNPKAICYKNKVEEKTTVTKENEESDIVIKECKERVIAPKVEENIEDYNLQHIKQCSTDNIDEAIKQEEETNIKSINDKPSISSSSSFFTKIFSSRTIKVKSLLKKKKKLTLMA